MAALNVGGSASTLDRRITSTFCSAPDAAEIEQFDRCERDLADAGFSLDVNNEQTIKDLLDIDSNGTTWYPGYFARWFFNGLAYKEHSTFLGTDAKLGPVCISVLLEQPSDPNGSRNIRALVRTQLGFHGVVLPYKQPSQQSSKSHIRGLSSNNKRLGSGRIDASGVHEQLDEILEAYFSHIKQRATSDSAITSKASLLSVPESETRGDEPRARGISCPDGMHAAEKQYYQTALKRWDSIRDCELVQHCKAAQIAAQLSEAPFPSICAQLHNMEKSCQTLVHDIDIIITGKIGDFGAMNSFFECLGTAVKRSKPLSADSLSLAESVASSKSVSEDRQKYIVQEFIETERRYVHNLHTLQSLFIDRVKVAVDGLKPTDLYGVFPKLNDIIAVNEEFLAELEESFANGELNIGETILKFITRFEVYRKYVANHSSASNRLDALMSENVAFRKFINAMEKDPQCEKLTIKDFLITPVQRLPRYGLLVKELLKYTAFTDPSYASLDQASIDLQSLNASMNETLTLESGYSRLFQIASSVSGCPADFIKRGRTFVDQYEVAEFDPAQPKDSTLITIMLFSDTILIAKRKASGAFSKKQKQELQFCAIYDLARLNIISLADRGVPDGYQIEAFVTSRKNDAIKLGGSDLDETKSRGRPRTTQHHPQDSDVKRQNGNDHVRVVRAFKFLSSVASQAFCLAYRKAVETLVPRQFSDGADIYRRWTDHNTDLIFHVYKNVSDYRSALDKSSMAILYSQDYPSCKDILQGACCKIAGIVQAKGNSTRACFHFGDLTLQPRNLRDDQLTVTKSKSKWWRQTDSGFANFFINKVEAVCDVALRYDKSYQMYRSLEACSQLKDVVGTQAMPQQEAAVPSNSLLRATHGLGVKSLGRSNSVKNLSRRGSSASEPSMGFEDDNVSERRQSFGDVESLERATTPSTFMLPNAFTSAIENKFSSVAKNIRHLSVSPRRRMSASTASLAKLSPNKWKTDFSASAMINPESTLSILRDLCSHIERVGIQTDGLYRINANKQKIEELLKVINHQPGNLREMLAQYDVHVAANAFRQWVVSIPKAVLCGAVACDCLTISKNQTNVIPQLSEKICEELASLNYNFVSILVSHLQRVAQQEPSNFMSSEKLAEIWGPIVLRTHMKQFSENCALQTHTLKIMIDNYGEIFKRSIGLATPAKLFLSDGMLSSATSSSSVHVPAVCLQPRRSLDGLLTQNSSNNPAPSLSPSSRASLPSIDEGFQSLVTLTPLSETLLRSSSLMIPRTSSMEAKHRAANSSEGGVAESKLLKRNSMGSAHRVQRVPVKYDSNETLDQTAARLSMQRAAATPSSSGGRREPQAGLPRSRQKSTPVSSQAQRRSISMPTSGTKSLCDAMAKICESSQTLLQSEKSRMSTEIESLNRQIKNLKKALENEIRYKNDGVSRHGDQAVSSGHSTSKSSSNQYSSSAKQWESLDEELAKIQDSFSRQMSLVGVQYDHFSSEIRNIVEIHRQMEQESMKAQERIHGLEEENEKLKALISMDSAACKQETLIMLQELEHYKTLASTLQAKQDALMNNQ